MKNKNRPAALMNLPNYKGFSITVTTEDKYNPIAHNLRLVTWLTPVDDEQNYPSMVKRHSKLINRTTYFNINRELFNERLTIGMIETAPLLYAYNKASYSAVDVTVAQCGNRAYNDETLLNELERLSTILIDTLIKRNDFIYAVTKKEIWEIFESKTSKCENPA